MALLILLSNYIFKIRYWIGFTSIFVAFETISSYSQRKMIKVYFYFFLLMFWNISTYFWALINSAPNVGDGFNPSINSVNNTDII